MLYEKTDNCLIAIENRLYTLDVYVQTTLDKIYTFNNNIKLMKELYSFNKDNNKGLVIINLETGVLFLFNY